MNRKEHLLTILSEECAEVSQRVSKALRFGLHEVQPGQQLNNAERITQEMADLLGIYEMLCIEEIIPGAQDYHIQQKRQKVEKFLKLSEQEGCLSNGVSADVSQQREQLLAFADFLREEKGTEFISTPWVDKFLKANNCG